MSYTQVLNLIINGIPSIPFNQSIIPSVPIEVLNLVINGIPSILGYDAYAVPEIIVLNLVINGIPSIR